MYLWLPVDQLMGTTSATTRTTTVEKMMAAQSGIIRWSEVMRECFPMTSPPLPLGPGLLASSPGLNQEGSHEEEDQDDGCFGLHGFRSIY